MPIQSRNDQLGLLRKLWLLHVNDVMRPRSSSYELLLTCLAMIYHGCHKVVEYGPYLGHMSFFLTTLASKQGGSSILVDNFAQLRNHELGIKDVACRNLLEASVSLIPDNRYSIVTEDVFGGWRPHEHRPDFVYYDICTCNRSAAAIHSMVIEHDNARDPVLIIIDDVVREHATNKEFLHSWLKLWSSCQPIFMRPILVTGNRLFLSNMEVQKDFESALAILEANNYVKKTSKLYDAYNWLPLWESLITEQKSTKSREFLNNDRLWTSLV